VVSKDERRDTNDRGATDRDALASINGVGERCATLSN